MAFCPNCGVELNGSPNFCPNCGQKLGVYQYEAGTAQASYTTASTSSASSAVSDTSEELPVHDVVLVRLDSCPKATCLDLLEDLLGYSTDLAEGVIKECPALIATSLTKRQAITIAQAFSEYGADMTIYTPDGAIDFEGKEPTVHITANSYSSGGYNGSIFKSDGTMIGLAAAVIGSLTAANLISSAGTYHRPGVYDNLFRPGYTTRPAKYAKRPPAPAPKPASFGHGGPARPAGSMKPSGGHNGPGGHGGPGGMGGPGGPGRR